MIEFSVAVNIAGAALFALVGIGILAVAGGTRRGRLIGAVATTFGSTWIAQNFLGGSFGSSAAVALASFGVLFVVASVGLVWHLVRDISARGRAWILMLGMLVAVAWPVFSAMRTPDGDVAALRLVVLWTYGAFLFSLVVLVGTIAIAFREATSARKGLACLGLAFGPFVTFLWAAFAASRGFGSPQFDAPEHIVLLILGATAAAAIVPFASARRAHDRISPAIFGFLVASGVAGIILVLATAPDYTEDYGAFGVVRTVGAFFLAVAVLRYDLLEVPLPRLAVRRGTVATAALALLLIVAEVAQNFFAAEYGLLMGGVIAGSLLFAASPIQRAMERGFGGSARRNAAVVYRAAVRAATADGAMTAAKEEHLAEVAEHLGLGPRDALRIRREAEDGVTS